MPWKAVSLSLAVLLLGAASSAFGQPAPPPPSLQAHFSSVESVVASLPGSAGVAFDAAGVLYVVDNANGAILTYKPAPGGGFTASPTPIVTGLNDPEQIAIDASGTLYIADTDNNQVLAEKLVSGAYQGSIIADGTPTFGLSQPFGVAVDSSGDVFIADTGNNRLVEEVLSGGTYTQTVVFDSTIPGAAGTIRATELAFDAAGNLYVTDFLAGRVLVLLNAGTLQSLSLGTPVPFVGGLQNPIGIALDLTGNMYIADAKTSTLYEVPAAAFVNPALTTITSGLTAPRGIAADASGNVYVANTGGPAVLEESFSGVNFGTVPVKSLSSSASVNFVFDTGGTLGSSASQIDAMLTQGAPSLDFTGAQAAGTCVAGQSYGTGTSCSISAAFTPSVSGVRYGSAQLLDGSGNVLASASLSGIGSGPQVAYLPGVQSVFADGTVLGFSQANYTAVDSSGNVYIPDVASKQVFKVTPAGTPSVVANAGSGLNGPVAVAVDGSGNVYISDSGNVIKASLSNGSYSAATIIPDVPGATGIAVDGAGNVYLAVNNQNVVLKETLQGGTYSQSTVASGLNFPFGVAVDGSGNVYITESQENNDLLKETLVNGAYTQTQIATGFSSPQGVSVDGNGNVYVASSGDNLIYKETLSGGSYTQTSFGTGLLTPNDVAVDGNGNIYIADTGNNRIVKEDYSDAPSLSFPSTVTGATSASQTVGLENIGNLPLVFGPGALVIPSSFNLDASGSCAASIASGSLDAGSSCVLSISFTPVSSTALGGALVLTDNNLNVAGNTQSIALSGTGIAPPDATSLSVVPSASSIVQGQMETITATVIDTTTSGANPVGTITLMDSNGASIPVSSFVNGVATGTYTPSGLNSSVTVTANFTPTDATKFVASNNTATFAVSPFGALTNLVLSKPELRNGTSYVGKTATFVVTATDAEGNVVPTTLPVTITSSDLAAVIVGPIAANTPPNTPPTGPPTLTNGLGLIRVIFETPGAAQTITVTASSATPAVATTSSPINVQGDPSFVVTVNTDAPEGNYQNCTDQSVAGATPDANCSLRDAVERASWTEKHIKVPVSISFAGSVMNPIVLSGTHIKLEESVSIAGPGAGLLSISGGSTSAIFAVLHDAVVNISGLTLTGGNTSQNGGAIYDAGTLTLTNMMLSGNTAAGNGGAVDVANRGTLNVIGSTLAGNLAVNGGAIASESSTSIVNSTITGNTASGAGGGIANTSENIPPPPAPKELGFRPISSGLTVTSSTITGNTAATTGGGIDSPNSVVMLANSMVAGNTATVQFADFNELTPITTATWPRQIKQ